MNKEKDLLKEEKSWMEKMDTIYKMITDTVEGVNA